jgi:hypothetical protein
MTPRQYLLSLGKSHVTIPDCAKALGIDNSALHYRIYRLPPEEKPEANGAFMAGGHLCFADLSAVAWIERHIAYWNARQAARGRSE